ncbi:hypothetical protein BH23GEM4_BH23GEM4_14260 [soil metagenome]
MDRNKWIALGIVALVAVFLLGWYPQWQRAQELDTRLETANRELAMARLEGRIGAALAESMRSNYERSRQLMTSAFEEMERRLDAGEITEPGQQQAVRAILAQRDELVTMLARAEPEAQQRLMLLYTRYYQAVDPEGRRAPTAVTPSAPPS